VSALVRRHRNYITIAVTRLIVAVATLATLGCEHAATGVSIPSVSGRTYSVVAVNGQPLPVAIEILGRGTCSSQPVFRSTLAFLADGTFEHTLVYTSDPTDRGSVFRASYVQDRDGRIHLSPGNGSGLVLADTLRLAVLSGLTCAANSWVAVAS